ncbi:hypothetical protein QM012_008314 [Aureobasidium pullulans]|uniref:Uncharacterized protein n=1 Tax=Aureobasidium pullulans TaxID=5580 RepID=A0ABR0TJD6_AURPU
MPPSTRRLERYQHAAEEHHDVKSTPLTKPFPFLELPDTVRQRFYELQLEAPRGFVRLFSKSGPLRANGKVTPAKVKVNIMFTCRQVYEEAMPVLYRVNNFCIAPLLLRPESAQDNGEIQQSEKWIRGMPTKGRNLINKLELWLPISPPDKSRGVYFGKWQDMKVLFPGLRTLTLFFDLNNQLDRTWWAIPDPDMREAFYQRFKASMPQARQTLVDLRMLKPSLIQWQPLLDTINKVWDVSIGESAYISQDIHHANKHAEQKSILDQALRDEFGPRAINHQGLSYWQIRQNLTINENLCLTDDDTDDEEDCFDKFDVKKIVALKRKKADSLEQGLFNFEEAEGSWW